MNIWDIDKLILFIAFVIPGFISLKAFELFYPSEKQESTKQIVEAITYSCINYAILFWPIYSIEKSEVFSSCRFLYFSFYIFVFLVAPILWAIIWKKIRTSNKFQKNAPHPTQKPWDFVFQQRKKYWIIITLKNGNKIAGKYGEKSFTSSAPANEQIYLEEHWNLNKHGGFQRKRNDTKGIIVVSDEIETVELFKY